MKLFISILFSVTLIASIEAQNKNSTITKDSTETNKIGFVRGVIIDATSNTTLSGVNITNLNQVIGAATNNKGEFELKARVNDTLHLSHLGYKSVKIRVTNDWVNKIEKSTISLTELALALEEVVISQLKLTGYLEVDIKQVTVNDNYRYKIPGIKSGYEAGKKSPGALSKVLGSIFNPVDFLYNTFSRKGKQMRKFKQMKQDDEIRNTLATRFDRDMLTALLGVTKIDLDEIISQCNYSKEFIDTANDLQVLDAINECYEEYKILSKSRKKRL